MKIGRISTSAMLIAGVLALSATADKKPTTTKSKASFHSTYAKVSVDKKASADKEAGESNQCGVAESQVISYLQNCSHHHTVYWLQDISGTCNTLAGVENCIVSTVYVNEGIIVGHMDVPYNCD